MRAGALRHVVELQRRTTSVTDHERSDAWSTFAKVRAEKRDPKGSEVVAAVQTQSEMTVEFRIRYREDVTPRDRLVWRGRVFGIRAVANTDHKFRTLSLHCIERVSDGD